VYYHDVLATSLRSLRTKSRWALLPRINSLFSPLSRFICLRFSCLRDSLTNRFFFVLVASAGPVFVVRAAVSNAIESRGGRVSVTHRSCTHHRRHQWPSSSSSPWPQCRGRKPDAKESYDPTHATKKVKLTDSFHEVLRKFLSSNETSFALPWVGGHYSGVLRTKSSRSSIERSPRSEDTDAEERDRLYYCLGLGRH
jgi:hypothetical protein